jgi:hypothetical protein
MARKKKTAKEIFEGFGFHYQEDRDIVRAQGYLTQDTKVVILFYDEYESYFVDVDDGKKLSWVNMLLHKAIDTCVKERGWGSGKRKQKTE